METRHEEEASFAVEALNILRRPSYWFPRPSRHLQYFKRDVNVRAAQKKNLDAEQELVGSNPTEKNWRGICIALVVILVVCGLITTAAILVNPKKEKIDYGEKFSFDDIFRAKNLEKTFDPQWFTDKDEVAFRNKEGHVVLYSITDATEKVLMDESILRQLDTEYFVVSPDKLFVLVAHKIQKVFRHTTLAVYKIYDVNEEKLTNLYPTGTSQESQDNTLLQLVRWSTRGHSLVYVYKNNLYHTHDPKLEGRPVTSDGVPGTIFNGIPDWLYEEEILSSDGALWWSTTGKRFCYAQFNDTNVPLYEFPFYGTGDLSQDQTLRVRYPSAGDPHPNNNPTVKLMIATKTSDRVIQVEVSPLQSPFQNRQQQYYFTTVTWRDDDKLVVVWLNRAQNHSIFTLCTASTGECTKIQHEEARHGRGWVDVSQPPVFNGARDVIFQILPDRYTSKDYYKHIARITVPDDRPGTRTYITMGYWDVVSILAYNSKENLIYYIGTGGDSRKRHLYSAVDVGFANSRQVACLSCNISDDCQFVSAVFSPSTNYYVLGCRGPAVPTYYLVETSTGDRTLMENNTELAAFVDSRAMPRIQYFEISVDGGYEAWGMMLHPAQLQNGSEHITTYPLIMDVYGGPGSQKVTFEFRLNWVTYMVSTHGYLAASIDGRGSGNKGVKYLHEIYKRFGTVEVEDQITGGRYFKEFDYVRKNETAIFGWSYGGFVSSSVLSRPKGTETFKCGIAVAPVTNWNYYDTAYTERYMGTPGKNIIGYEQSNVTKHAANIKNSNFLLVHGTKDDNVHFRNSAELMRTLVDEGVDFRTQIYIDQSHAISGTTANKHLYQTLTNFLLDCFSGSTNHTQLVIDHTKLADTR